MMCSGGGCVCVSVCFCTGEAVCFLRRDFPFIQLNHQCPLPTIKSIPSTLSVPVTPPPSPEPSLGLASYPHCSGGEPEGPREWPQLLSS